MSRRDWTFNRRDFIRLGVAASGGLVVGYFSKPKLESQNLASFDDSPDIPMDGVEFSAWLQIQKGSGKVFLYLDKAEMGQGVVDAFPIIVAEQLNLPPEEITVKPAYAGDYRYVNPAFGIYATGGSTSVAVAFEPLQTVAAATRDLLIQAAQKRMNAPFEQFKCKDGLIYNEESGESWKWGELVEIYDQQNLQIHKVPQILINTGFVGKDRPRRNISSKVTGEFKYGIDGNSDTLQLGEKVFGAIVRCPEFGGEAQSWSRTDNYREIIRSVFKIPGAVAVTGVSYWHCKEVARQLKVTWNFPNKKKYNNKSLATSFKTNVDRNPRAANIKGLTRPDFNLPDSSHSVEYLAPFVGHSPLEPMNCIVKIANGGVDIWCASQVPQAAQELASSIAGVPRRNVKVHLQNMGGSFGRRIQQDYVVFATHMAKKVGQSVHLIYTREDDTMWDFYRPSHYHRISAVANSEGEITHWKHRIVGPSIFVYSSDEFVLAIMPSWVSERISKFFGRLWSRFLTSGYVDPTSVEGARPLPYDMDKYRVEFVEHESALPVGFWRSVGFSLNTWVVESFIDELAEQSGVSDPMEFRLKSIKRKVAKKGSDNLFGDQNATFSQNNRFSQNDFNADTTNDGFEEDSNQPGVNKSSRTFLDGLRQYIGRKRGVGDFRENRRLFPFTFLNSPIFHRPRASRSLRVLERLNQEFGWNRPLSQGRFKGVAQGFCFGSYCAQAVEISIVDSQVKVHRVVAVVDCGKIIQPDTVKQQIEGGIIFALSAALKQEIQFENNQVLNRNFGDSTNGTDILRFNECPGIEVHIIESDNQPTGVGELGVPALAPALCNAVYQATGKRIRQLPIKI